jgi:hypothetical protein
VFHFFSASSPISTAISLGVLYFVFRFGGLYVDTVELQEQVLETLTKDVIYQEEREKEREATGMRGMRRWRRLSRSLFKLRTSLPGGGLSLWLHKAFRLLLHSKMLRPRLSSSSSEQSSQGEHFLAD